MKGLFIPEITTEMFKNGCLESIEQLMAEGEIYDIDYPLEQEPKTGHWIRQKSSYGSTYICSACNRDIYLIGYPAQDFKEHNYDFCPNCGAKMESEE